MSCYFDYNCCSVYKAPPNRQKSSSIVLSPSSSPVRLIAHTRHTDINHNVFKYTAVAEVSMDRRQWTLCASNECFRYLPMRRQHSHPACTYNGSVLLLLYYFYYCTHTYLTRGMSHIDVRGQRWIPARRHLRFFYLHMRSVHALNRWRHWVSFINSSRRGNDRLLQRWCKIVV